MQPPDRQTFSISRYCLYGVVLLLCMQFLTSCTNRSDWQSTLRQAESIEKREDYKESRKLYEQAIEQAKSSGVADLELNSAYIELARVCQLEGDHETARNVIDAALERSRKTCGENSPRLASLLRASAELHYKQHDLEQAEAQARQLLTIEKSEPDPDKMALIDTINLIISAACARDRCIDTEPLVKEQLELRRQLYGSEHPQVAVSFALMGEIAEK